MLKSPAMRYSQLFGKTKKTAPADADSPNARFLTQGGFVDRLAAGIYQYLPLGFRVLEKIKKIIQEEMNAIGGQQILMPVLNPVEIWKQTGRDETIDDVLYRTEGAGGHEFVLAPSHEEPLMVLAQQIINSYKDLPYAPYHIQLKFRNEARAKAGVLRGREFMMKDMYSYHVDDEDFQKFYEQSKVAYFNVFKRCGLEAYMIEASGGAFSDNISHEFVVKTMSGEDTMLLCEKCSFAQNLEIAEARIEAPKGADEEEKPLEKIDAVREPDIKASADLHVVPEWKVLKSVIYKVNGGLLGVCIRGDLKVDTKRLEQNLKEKIRGATAEDLKEAGLVPGFISPIGAQIPFIADHSIKYVKNFSTGANELHKDYKNANLGRDFQVKEFLHLADLPLTCPNDGGALTEERVIEVGNIFTLGTKYTEAFDVKFTDKDGKQKYPTMGCYGIGVTRLVGTVVEASHDEKGIIWPESVAPFQVHLLTLGNDDDARAQADKLYKELQTDGVEVLYDDRDESTGKKLNDADLIGIPLRVIVSKKSLEKGGVEVKARTEKESNVISVDELEKLIIKQ